MTTPTSINANAAEGDSAVSGYVAERGVTEILHFTTAPNGVVGICATGAVLCRERLDEEKYIEHIYRPNTHDRLKDHEWIGYVNLSISRVNKHMLDRSDNWHTSDGMWWAVLSFDPVILSHPGVYFTTTNNIYSDTVRRATGVDGLRDMFSDCIPWGYYGSVARRNSNTPNHWTTEKQAEVLYPDELPLTHLRAVYVAEAEHIDDVKAWIDVFPKAPSVPVIHRPEVFA